MRSQAAPGAAFVARMEKIGAGLGADDGVACFNELYLAVTREVGRAGRRGHLRRRGVPLHPRQHRDFLKVNDTLKRVQERVKARYAHGLVGWADKALGRVDDVVAAWKVARVRDAAWTNAEALRALRRVPRAACAGRLPRDPGSDRGPRQPRAARPDGVIGARCAS